MLFTKYMRITRNLVTGQDIIPEQEVELLYFSFYFAAFENGTTRYGRVQYCSEISFTQ